MSMKTKQHLSYWTISWIIATSAALPLQAAELSGRVTAGMEKPIPSAIVVVEPLSTLRPTFNAKTDADGVYRITGIPDGWYSIAVRASGFAQAFEPSIEIKGIEAKQDIRMRLASASGEG